MLLFLLLVIFIILLVGCYLAFRRDIIQPAVIITAVFTFSLFSAFINRAQWKLNDMHLETFMVILFGTLEFILISYLFMNHYYKYIARERVTESFSGLKEIYISNSKIVIILLYDLITIALLLRSALQIANQFGNPTSLSQALQIFRDNTSMQVNASLPGYVNWLQKGVFGFAYAGLYLFINNFLASKDRYIIRIKNNIPYLLAVLGYVALALANSTRGPILNLASAMVMMTGILWYRKHHFHKMISIRTIIKFILIVALGLILFYLSTKLIGRITGYDLIGYITLYAGGSISNLDQYFSQPAVNSDFIGIETFNHLIRNLIDFGFIKANQIPSLSLEFRYAINGLTTGNIYTVFRRWIADFGVLGVVVLNAGMAAFYNYFYYKLLLCDHDSLGYKFGLMVFGYLSYPLFMYSIEALFYDTIFRMAFITQTIIMYICFMFMIVNRRDLYHFKVKMKLEESID